MINVCCRTTIDEYKGEEWPTQFCCRPLKGDKVVSRSGNQLSVVGIIHTAPKGDHVFGTSDIPYLIVELHKSYPGLGGE